MSQVIANKANPDLIRVRPVKIMVVLTALSAIVFFLFSISAEPRTPDSGFVAKYGHFVGAYLRNIIALLFGIVSMVALIQFRVIDVTNNAIRVRGLVLGKLMLERSLDDVVEVRMASSRGTRPSLPWLRSHIIIFSDGAKINIPIDYSGAAEAMRRIDGKL